VYEIRTREAIARTYTLLRSAGALEEEDPAGVPSGARGPGRTLHLKGGREA